MFPTLRNGEGCCRVVYTRSKDATHASLSQHVIGHRVVLVAIGGLLAGTARCGRKPGAKGRPSQGGGSLVTSVSSFVQPPLEIACRCYCLLTDRIYAMESFTGEGHRLDMDLRFLQQNNTSCLIWATQTRFVPTTCFATTVFWMFPNRWMDEICGRVFGHVSSLVISFSFFFIICPCQQLSCQLTRREDRDFGGTYTVSLPHIIFDRFDLQSLKHLSKSASSTASTLFTSLRLCSPGID